MMSSAAPLVLQSVPQSRLRLEQFLLIIGYLLTTYDVPYRLLNSNQIRDIIRRPEVEWQPSIGTELYEELKKWTWEERDRKNNETWDILCRTVTKVHEGRLTQKDARDKLRWLLWRLQQISRDPFDEFVLGDKPREGPQLGWRFNITLLGISVAVLPCEPDFPDDLTSLTPGQLKTMESDLNRSDLFRDDPLDKGRLETALEWIWDSLQDPKRPLPILSGSEPVLHEEAGSQLHFHPICHRGSQSAYDVPKASNSFNCESDHSRLAAHVDHDVLRPSCTTDTQFDLTDPFHEYRMQLKAIQYQSEVQWRLRALEDDVQRIKNQLGM
jgi:hypothetical protein